MRIADRIAKLRRLAEDGRGNPYEMALARDELERLDALKASDPLHWGRTRADAIERLRRNFHPGKAGYYEWARRLAVGAKVRICRTDRWIIVDHVPVEDPKTPEPIVRIERLTATQYVTSDGSRFRRIGCFPGYKVGETGREGYRTYIAPAEGKG